MRIGMIGAGFIGRAAAKLAVLSGFDVMISNSRDPKSLTSAVASIGCRIGTSREAADFADVILLAVPFYNFRAVPADMLAGKIVMDANNYYPNRDGPVAALDNHTTTTSELIADHFRDARIVKAFNAILERHILPHANLPERRALPIAGDDFEAKRIVTDIHNAMGYDVVDAGPLAEGWRFERARPAYCRRFDRAGLLVALANAESMVPEGSWGQTE